jgi:hypothetical protein
MEVAMHRSRRSRVISLLIAPLLIALTLAMVGGLATVAAASRGICNTVWDPVVEPSDFTTSKGKPNAIDNPYMPLRPHTTFRYEGTLDGQEQVGIVEVTGATKTILGVTTTVVRDTVYIDGVLAEDTFDWFAQDDDGNVWYFGEDTKEFDEQGNVISTEGSWEAGVDGAVPGIIMLAEPTKGDSYRQEFAPDVAEDAATVLSVSDTVTVPYGTFDDVLRTADFNCLETGVDYKSYAPGVGFVFSDAGGSTDERLELVSVKRG